MSVDHQSKWVIFHRGAEVPYYLSPIHGNSWPFECLFYPDINQAKLFDSIDSAIQFKKEFISYRNRYGISGMSDLFISDYWTAYVEFVLNC